MRQEKTMKVIINHFLDPRITLSPNVGNDKSWVWTAFDFAEGTLIETVIQIIICVIYLYMQIFALRFSNAEIAQEYKKAFVSGQEEMKVLMEKKETKEEKEEKALTEAIETLKIEEKKEVVDEAKS